MSVVKDALFDRTNTKTNTPCIIHTEISDEFEIKVFIKGGGSENATQITTLSPTSTEDEIIEFVKSSVAKTGAKACPPYFLGVGIGATTEIAGLLSKKAVLLNENIDEQHQKLAEKIKKAVNELNIGAAGVGGNSTCLDVKIITAPTHIACMPVALTINCHSTRFASLKNKGTENRKQETQSPVFSSQFSNYIKVNTSDVSRLKSLKQGDNVLLSGTIYTARDAAHKRLVEMIKKGEKLPFDLKNSIIFYAGPCPGGKCNIALSDKSLPNCENGSKCGGKSAEKGAGCIVGSIGPTTASRMDKFAKTLYENGVLATIGKGERSEETKIAIKKTGGLYFTAIGGIACLLSGKVRAGDVIAFEDLGAEAVYKLEVKDFPVRLSVG